MDIDVGQNFKKHKMGLSEEEEKGSNQFVQEAGLSKQLRGAQ
jgi:hypothetical protein